MGFAVYGDMEMDEMVWPSSQPQKLLQRYGIQRLANLVLASDILPISRRIYNL